MKIPNLKLKKNKKGASEIFNVVLPVFLFILVCIIFLFLFMLMKKMTGYISAYTDAASQIPGSGISKDDLNRYNLVSTTKYSVSLQSGKFSFISNIAGAYKISTLLDGNIPIYSSLKEESQNNKNYLFSFYGVIYHGEKLAQEAEKNFTETFSKGGSNYEKTADCTDIHVGYDLHPIRLGQSA